MNQKNPYELMLYVREEVDRAMAIDDLYEMKKRLLFISYLLEDVEYYLVDNENEGKPVIL